MSKIQNSDVKGQSDVTANSRLVNTDKIYVTKTTEILDDHLKKTNSTTSDPTASNDGTQGYEVGSRWWNTSTDKEFVCLDSTTSSAVWTETTGAGGGGGSVTIREEDGSPTGTLSTLKVSNGALTDNGGGDFSLDTNNTYGAVIDNNGSSASIITQGGGAISSVSRTGTGTVQVNFTASFFSTAPAVVVTCTNGSNRNACIQIIPSTTGVRITTEVTSTGSLIDDDFHIMMIRQGSDFRG